MYAHPWLVVGVSTVLLAAAGWLASTDLGVMNDVNALIRKDSQVLRFYRNYQEEFQTRDPMVVVIRSGDVKRNEAVAEFLAGRVGERPEEIQEIFYKVDFSKLMTHLLTRSGLIDRMKPYLLHYKEPGELEGIVEQLRTQKELFAGTKKKGVNLNSLLSEALKRFDELEKNQGKDGSLENLDEFADRMIANMEGLAAELQGQPGEEGKDEYVDAGEEDDFDLNVEAEIRKGMEEEIRKRGAVQYLAFEEGRLLLMMLTPTEGNTESFKPYEEVIRHLRKDIGDAKEEFRGVDVGLTGEPVLLDDELKQSERDMVFSACLALILIAVAFFITFGEVVMPLLALVVLVYSLVWSLGFAVISVGHLNVISQAFVLMLMGLGIDFGIQVLGRYEEERAAGRSVEEALRNTLENTGAAVVVGGSITAVAFFTMCFNDFLGLAELGVIAGAGILLSLTGNMVLLPALLTLKERMGRRKEGGGRKRVRGLGKGVDGLLLARPGLVLTVAGGMCVAAALMVTKIRFDYNLLNLQHPEMPAAKLARELLASSADSLLFGVVIADNLEDARAKERQLAGMETVKSVRSPVSILEEIGGRLPNEMGTMMKEFLPQDQEKKLPILKKIQREVSGLRVEADLSSRLDVPRAREDLGKLLEYSREGLAEAKKFRQAKDKRAKLAYRLFNRLVPALEKALAQLKQLKQEDAVSRLGRYQTKMFSRMEKEFGFLKSLKLGEPMREDVLAGLTVDTQAIGVDDLPDELRRRYVSANGKIVLEVIPKENIWEREANEAFVKDLHRVSAEATGTPVQNDTYIRMLKDAYLTAALWALVAIVVLVSMHFRRVKPTFLVLLPLGIGILWTLGTMGWTGLEFNPANIITLPLVIGIGVAYGVYVLDRYQEAGEVRLFSSSTGKAILLSALTTIIGFGSMMTGMYVGLVSLGSLMSLSILFCFLASVVVLPQILGKRRD